MKRKNNGLMAILVLLLFGSASAQMQQYAYKRELKGVRDQWHKIILPDDMFGKTTSDLSDIRLFGVTSNNDTISAPFLLQVAAAKTTLVEISFWMINESGNRKGWYYTFESPVQQTINRIKLNFSQANFDWRVMLEGSQDQRSWFTIADNYRILSIRNNLTDYQFTTLAFPDARYRYFRLRLNSDEKPVFLNAGLFRQETTMGKARNYAIVHTVITEDAMQHQTKINIELPSPVPVNSLTLPIKDSFDYYRPFSIRYLADSFKTEKGWSYEYRDIVSGTLSSVEKKELLFSSTILSRLELKIDNGDNRPLQIGSCEIKGDEYYLLARFTEPAKSWWLVYGNSQALRPRYDIELFADKIPPTVVALLPAEEHAIQSPAPQAGVELFQNKRWLWTLMFIIILVIGWFTLKMMRKG